MSSEVSMLNEFLGINRRVQMNTFERELKLFEMYETAIDKN